MAVAVCQQCGKSFTVRPSRQEQGKGLYCSRQCYFESKRRYAFVKTCEHCGKIFYTKREEARFCSRACAGKEATRPDAPVLSHGVSSGLYSEYRGAQGPKSFEDPWASGAIPPDCYGRDLYRMPDVWLGF